MNFLFLVVEIKILWWVDTYIQLKYFADALSVLQVTVSSHRGILQSPSAWLPTQSVSQYMNISPHKWPKLPRIGIAGFLNRTRRIIFMWMNTDGSYPLHQRPTLRDIEWDLSIMNKPISSATGPSTKNIGMTVTICYWDAQARKLQRFATFNLK